MLLEVMSGVESRPLEWVWEGVVPLGKLTLLIGEPGIGKSLVAMDTIARATQGRQGLAEDPRGLPGDVILFAGEDDLCSTIRPRLDAAGAVIERVSVVQNFDVDPLAPSSYERPRLDEDLSIEMLECCLRGNREANQPVQLIVIDPINCYLDHIDSQHEDRVRVMASKLADLAQRCNVAILLIAQPARVGIGKRGAWMPTTRVFAKAARSVWLVTQDPDDGQRRLLLPIKTNLCALPPGFGFQIQNQAIVWETDAVSMTAEQYLEESQEQQRVQVRQKSSELTRVVDWLRARLSQGEVPSSLLREEAAEIQMTEATLRRALRLLNCQKSKEKCATGRWFWRLPEPWDEAAGANVEVAQPAQIEQL